MPDYLFVTTAGRTDFLTVLWDSFYRNTGDRGHVTMRLMLDVKAMEAGGYEEADVARWADERSVPITRDTSGRGLNALWSRCIHECGGERLCVVANDDIYITPGWMDAIDEVLTKNDHVALCGIAADGDAMTRLHAQERWFSDPSLFSDEHIWEERYRKKPVAYVPWCSGIMFATKPELWLRYVGAIDDGLYWGYGEPDQAMKLWKNAGLYSVAIMFPGLLFHYGGGCNTPGISKWVGEHSTNDWVRFEELYGGGASDLDGLLADWNQAEIAEQAPPLVYDATRIAERARLLNPRVPEVL